MFYKYLISICRTQSMVLVGRTHTLRENCNTFSWMKGMRLYTPSGARNKLAQGALTLGGLRPGQKGEFGNC